MNASKSGRWLAWVTWSVPFLALGLAVTAGANPMPESAIYVHVQPVQPEFCESSPITECGQIVQYTYATGELEFDIFLWGPQPEYVSACALHLAWPTTWQYLDGQICHGGYGGIDVAPGSASLWIEWPWPDCPMIQDEVLLAARLLFDVDSYGELSVRTPATITWGCPPEGDPVPVDVWSSATAGVICAYCYDKCPGTSFCQPILAADELQFELPPGGTDQRMIEAGVYPPYEFQIDFDDTESWMTLSVEHPGPWPDYWQVTVTVDATGLEPGRYEGWVTATCDCRDCTHVTLDVLAGQGIPDEPDVAPLDSVRSWGGIKSLFR
jgi:hypothetical protein